MSNTISLKSSNGLSSKKITAKQLEFARLIAEEHIISSDAYRKAYKPKSSAKKKSIHEMACRVLTNIKVQSMIKSIQREKYEDNRMRAIRREEYVLKKLMEEVEQGGKASTRIRALELLGKTVSMFSNKVDKKLISRQESSEELIEVLKLKLNNLLRDSN